MPAFTVVGESIVDLIEDPSGAPVASPGGSPANVAVALARLGQPVRLLTQLGDDAHGRLLRAHLGPVRLASGSIVDSPRTSTARTRLSADGQARYAFDITWRRFPPGAGGADPATACLHTGSLATLLAPGADDVAAIVGAARAFSTISFDPNCRPSLVDDVQAARARIEGIVADSDVVKASIEDLAWLYPGRSYVDIGAEWLDRGAGIVVVTRGEDGAWARTRTGQLAVDAIRVDVVDTIGAGDAFTAGLLAALARAGLLGAARRTALAAVEEKTLRDVLTFASRVAAATCGRRGADPPTLADLDADPPRADPP